MAPPCQATSTLSDVDFEGLHSSQKRWWCSQKNATLSRTNLLCSYVQRSGYVRDRSRVSTSKDCQQSNALRTVDNLSNINNSSLFVLNISPVIFTWRHFQGIMIVYTFFLRQWMFDEYFASVPLLVLSYKKDCFLLHETEII